MSLDVLGKDHPWALEFASLHEAVAHYQHEAHRAAIQLQHHSLEYASTLQHLHSLESENALLRNELQVHRNVGSGGESHRDALQVQELTLALRRLSDKLDLTESVLLKRNEELVTAHSNRDEAIAAYEHALETVNHLRSKLEASRMRERDLMNCVRESEEQRKMSDLVVREYANLVRSLEGRPSLSSQPSAKDNGASPRSSLEGLARARQGLNKLLEDSNSEIEKLHAEIGRLNDALDSVRAELEVEKATAVEDRQRLAQAQLELHQLKSDDNAAVRMVARYMKFSQTSTNVLHAAIENLKKRQEAIISSYESRLEQAEGKLAFERRQSEILRRALDELTEDISRESYGRRREVILRLALLAREENVAERLRRWILRSQETLRKTNFDEERLQIKQSFATILRDAEDILSSIDASASDSDLSSSAARIYAAHASAKALQEELQRETDRRLYFEYQLATSLPRRSEPNTPASKALNVGSRQNSSPTISPSVEWGTSEDSDDIPSTSQPSTGAICDLRLSPPRDEPSPIDQLASTLMKSTFDTSHSAPVVTVGGSDPTELASHKNLPDLHVVTSQVENGDKPSAFPQHETPLGHPVVTSSHPVQSSDLSVVEDSANHFISQPVGVSDSIVPTDQVDSITEAPTPPALVTTSSSTAVALPKQPDLPSRLNAYAPMDNAQSLSPEHPTGSETQEPVPIICESFTPSELSMPQDERYKSYSNTSPVNEEKTGLKDSSFADTTKDASLALLITRLTRADDRYLDLQNAFRDCHLALQELGQMHTDKSNFPRGIIERLCDYCEDAQVELEIRISDEERIAKGFQTLLSVPGALSDEINEQEVMLQTEAFLDGTDPTVHRTRDMLMQKLENLQHDIASVKHAVHNPSSPVMVPNDVSQDTVERPKALATSGWASWTGSILGPSRGSSPAPSFGVVMTSPRLRHSSSSRSLRATSSNAHNSFANLGLRIPMPIPNLTQRHTDDPPPLAPMAQRDGGHPRLGANVLGLGLRGGFVQGMRRTTLGTNNISISIPSPPKDADELDGDID